MKKLSVRAIATGLLLAIGTLILTYPFAAQWFEQLRQTRANEMLANSVNSVGPAILDELYASAQDYNEQLASGLMSPRDGRYLEEMLVPGTDVIARLRIPSIDLDQPIRHTMDEPALVNGVGHALGTSLPIGGPSTHAVLGSHRGLAESVGFTHLPKVKVGDTVYIEALGRTLTYKVIETEVLEPEAAALHPIEIDRDLVTLLTCTPMGVNSHRFVVVAERLIPGDDIPFGQKSDQPGFPWWAVFGSIGLVFSGIASWIVARRESPSNQPRHRKDRRDPHDSGSDRTGVSEEEDQPILVLA